MSQGRTCERHDWNDPANVYVYPDGRRCCRACQTENARRKRLYGKTSKPLAALRPRRIKRKSSAKLTTRQVFAAHELYQAGMSLSELADAGWERWGYANAWSAETNLRSAFMREALPTRPRAEAIALWHRRYDPLRKCGSCGCDYESRTKGCRACTNRASRRRVKRGRRDI